MSYHAGNSFYFERTDDGGVCVRLEALDVYTPAISLTAAEWASVVAAVCARGESVETHGEALTFHQARPRPTAI